MKFLFLGFALLSFNAMACWNMQATISVNEDKLEINQKIDHDKTYSFSKGKHLFHVKIPSSSTDKKNVHSVKIGVQEKKGITLSEISQGEIIVQTGKEATMTKHNNETGETTTFTMKITEI